MPKTRLRNSVVLYYSSRFGFRFSRRTHNQGYLVAEFPIDRLLQMSTADYHPLANCESIISRYHRANISCKSPASRVVERKLHGDRRCVKTTIWWGCRDRKSQWLEGVSGG